jgi:uncharacterized MAPEG superfamily protein
MTIPLYCVLGAFLLNYISKIPLMVAMSRAGGYDNRNPRDQQAKLTGWGRRALGAHLNSFEVSPLFASCVLIGHLASADPQRSSILAAAFLVSRVIYTGLYLADKDQFRSLVWGFGIFCSFAIPFC